MTSVDQIRDRRYQRFRVLWAAYEVYGPVYDRYIELKDLENVRQELGMSRRDLEQTVEHLIQTGIFQDPLSEYAFRLSPVGIEFLEETLLERARLLRKEVTALELTPEQQQGIEINIALIEQEAVAGGKRRAVIQVAASQMAQFLTGTGAGVTASVLLRHFGF